MSCVLFSQLGYRPKYIFSIFSSCGEIPGKYMHIAYTSFIQNHSYHHIILYYYHIVILLSTVKVTIDVGPLVAEHWRINYIHQTHQTQVNSRPGLHEIGKTGGSPSVVLMLGQSFKPSTTLGQHYSATINQY